MERGRDREPSATGAIEAARAALLVIDAQNWVMDEANRPPRPEFYAAARETVIPNIARLIAAARAAGAEVVYTVMENATRDGRDRSLDYKLSGFFIAKGSRDARVIDASTAHRTHPDWVYGLPEYDSGQPKRIAEAARISNPGCYALTSVALLHPLIAGGLIPADHPVTINAVSGYSGGGKPLIARFENPDSPDRIDAGVRVYALNLTHKHVPEIQTHAGLSVRPLFVPSVGRYRQGMIVQIRSEEHTSELQSH